MSASASVKAGVTMAIARVRPRVAIGSLAAALVAALVIAIVERRDSPPGAGDRTVAALFRIVIPLTAFALSQLTVGPKNLKEALWPGARFGLHRGWLGVGHVLASAALAAAGALAVAVLGLVAARIGKAPTPREMSFGADVITTAWIAPLVGAAYAAWFGLGATFGKVGGGRGWVLAFDFALGSVGFFGVVLPRGSAYNLIGLAAPLDVPQRLASFTLVGSALCCLGLLLLRCRR